MKTKIFRISAILQRLVSLSVILMFFVSDTSAAEVSNQLRTPQSPLETSSDMRIGKDEALAIADMWYAMELNRISSRMNPADVADRFSRLNERQIYYLVSENNLLDKPPTEGQVLAYVIKYVPTGYVVVSGSDRIEPIIVFSAESNFRWDRPDLNFLRYFLGKDLPNRWNYLEERLADGIDIGVHANWEHLRSRLRVTNSLEDAKFIMAPDAILVEWDTAAWGQMQFYNDVVVANNGNTTGIPTGCTATAMAIKMRFHKWPDVGASSHTYTDTWGTVQFSHSINFGTQTYDYEAMPVTSLTAPNAAIANLMYHAGVAVDMNYEVGRSGAWPTAYSMNYYFGYKGTMDRLSNHYDPIKDSIRGGLPVVLSTRDHTMVADGYRDTEATHFHINAGWDGNNDGWYSLNTLPGGDLTINMSTPYSSPSNYFYVDPNWTGTENGNIQNPYNTYIEGFSNTPKDGHLWLKAGSYIGTFTFSEAITIHSYEGTATLGE